MKTKRSLKYLLVSACLALLLVSIGGVLAAADTPVAATTGLEIKGASLDLSDKISIAFVVEATVAGEDAENGSVHLYSTNPTGTAAAGEEVTTTKLMTIGGKQYVAYISEGFAPVEYGETVYARFMHKNGTVGKVQKTSVIELVKGMQANLKDTDAKYEAKVGLYNAILTYGVKAQAVLGSDYPVYNYFTVADGGYVDNAGAKWTTGVVEKGTEVELVATPDLGLPTIWSDGTNEYVDSVTVSSDKNYSFSHYDMSLVNDNPWVTGWNGLASSNYSEGMLAQMLTDQSVEKITSTYVASSSTRSFSLNESGKGVYSVTQPNRYYKDVTTADTSSTSNSSGNQYVRLSTIGSRTNQSSVISFTLNFPGNDVNGNGTNWDYGPDSYTVDVETGLDENDEPIYDTVTYYQNGDMFKGGSNAEMLRFQVVSATGATSSAAEILMYLNFAAVTETNADGVKVVKGWQLKPANGTNGDKNKYTVSTVYDIETSHDVDIEFVPAEDGTVSEIKIYIDGALSATHKASNGTDAKYGIYANTKKLFSATKDASYIGFDIGTLGRFVGDYEVSNIKLTMKNNVTKDQLADYGYSTNMSDVNHGAIVAGYDVANQTTVHYAWNELVDGAKHVLLQHNDVTKSYWMYNAANDSVIVDKIASTGAGTANFLIENPLYGMTAADWDGEVAVFEFNMAMLNQDRTGDGLYDTDLDNRKSSGSSVWGQLNIGYGDGQYDYSRAYVANNAAARTINGISANNALLGNFRIVKSNQSSDTSKMFNVWQLSYYYQTTDGGNSYSAGYNGSELNVRLVVTPDETGVPAQLDIYINNVLVTTRYNESGDKTGFTFYDEETQTGAFANFFEAPYFEISQFMREDGYAYVEFSNFRSWMRK